MITLTIVRHGESTDNLKATWAGNSDAPLSTHGMNQAKALGQSLASTKIHMIVASTLLRALWTAQQVARCQPDPKPAFTTSPLLKEQHFGIAEHQPFGEKGGFTRKPGRSFKFEGGESLDDVRARATSVIAEFIEPSLRECRGRQPNQKHIVLVAHGIFNAELVAALLARTNITPPGWSYKGMTNTGWTRLEIGYESEGPERTDHGPEPETINSTQRAPPLTVRILCTDVTKHLDGVHRQKGGIGSQAFDEKQKDLRAFFAGGGRT